MTVELTPEEILQCCGPDWSDMTDAEKAGYGPKFHPLRGRAERTRLALTQLAREWGLILVEAA